MKGHPAATTDGVAILLDRRQASLSSSLLPQLGPMGS